MLARQVSLLLGGDGEGAACLASDGLLGGGAWCGTTAGGSLTLAAGGDSDMWADDLRGMYMYALCNLSPLMCVRRDRQRCALQAKPAATRTALPWPPQPLPCGSPIPSGSRVPSGASGGGSRGAGQSPSARGAFGPLARVSPESGASGGAAAAAASSCRGKIVQRPSSAAAASPLYRRRSLLPPPLPPAAPLATEAEVPLITDQVAATATDPQAEGRVGPRWLGEERVARPLLLMGLLRPAKRGRPDGEGGGLWGRGVPVPCLEDSDADEGLSEPLSGCPRRQGVHAVETLSGMKKEEATGDDASELPPVSAMPPSSLAAIKTDGSDDLPPTSAVSPSSLATAETGLRPHHPKRPLLEAPQLTEEQGAPKRQHHHPPGGGTPAPAPAAGTPPPSSSPVLTTAAGASSAPPSPSAGSAAGGSDVPLAVPMAVTVAAGLGAGAVTDPAPDGDAEGAPRPAPMQALHTGVLPSAAQEGRAAEGGNAALVPPSAAQVEQRATEGGNAALVSPSAAQGGSATEGGNASNVAVAACCARVRAEAEAEFERVLACQVLQQVVVLPCRHHFVNPLYHYMLCGHFIGCAGFCRVPDPVLIPSTGEAGNRRWTAVR